MPTDSTTCHITLHPVGRRSAARYRAVDRETGEVLVENSRQPVLDAARVMAAGGARGRLIAWHGGAAYPAMVVDIARAAKLTVVENDRRGPVMVEAAPVSVTDVSRVRLRSLAAISKLPGGGAPATHVGRFLEGART